MLSFFDMESSNIRIMWFLVNAALVFLVVGSIAAVVSLVSGHVSIEGEFPHLGAALPPGVSLKHTPTVTVDVADPTLRQRLLSAGTAAAPAVLIAVVLLLLRGLVGSVKEGDPFGRRNVRR